MERTVPGKMDNLCCSQPEASSAKIYIVGGTSEAGGGRRGHSCRRGCGGSVPQLLAHGSFVRNSSHPFPH